MIDLDEVSKRYGTKLAVDRLSFGVSPGEILGLAGPSERARWP